MLRDDRDEKDGHLKKLRKTNEELRKKLQELEKKNDLMSVQIQESFSSGPKDITNMHPATAMNQIGMHH